jgi:hypothetical protein
VIRFSKGILTISPPLWLARLLLGRKRIDAAMMSAVERAAAHGSAKASVRLGPFASADIEARKDVA